MRWFKHMSDSWEDEKLSRIVDEAGLEGYGFWWRMVEIVASKVDENNDTLVTFSIKKWCSLFVVRPQKLRRLLTLCEDCDMFKSVSDGNMITVNIPNILKYRDEWTRKKSVKKPKTPEQLPSKEEDTEEDIYISPLTPLPGGDEPPLELAEVTHDERTRERENAMFADCPTGSVNNACGTARKQEPTPEGKKVTEKKKASRKPKGADLPPYSDWFEECWKVYPNRNGKGPAWRAFYELQQEGELPEDLQLRIEYRALEDDWKENVKVPGRLRFIPRMSSWLHARGWEDEGCFCEPDPRNTPEDARRNAIMAKYSFGMPRAGESPQEVLARCARMDAELEAEGLL